MKGLIETVRDGGNVHVYRDFTKQDFNMLFDNWEPTVFHEALQYEFLLSHKANQKMRHELKRWWRWENGCPTSMDKFIRKLESKESRAYKLKLKNKHKYGKATKTKRHSRKRKA